jgi:hypothetical protein
MAYCLRGAVSEGTATRRAADGDGRPGVFVVEDRRCARTCSWYGPFVPRNGDRIPDRDFELRGADEDELSPGRRVPALDVGSGEFVHAQGGSPEWGATVSQSMGVVFLGGLGLAALISSCRSTRAARRPMGPRP